MEVKESVTLVRTVGKNPLYTLFLSAFHGEYTEIARGNDTKRIKELENTVAKLFDEFATAAFNKGREYEQNRHTEL